MKQKKKPKKEKKATKKTISKLQKELWELCRTLVKYRDGTRCFTCNAEDLSGSNWQIGHFIPKSVCGTYLKYDLRNLAVQCMRCNIHGGGMGAEFYRRNVEKHGQEWVDNVFAMRNWIIKSYDYYEKLMAIYGNLIKEIPKIDRKTLYGEPTVLASTV